MKNSKFITYQLILEIEKPIHIEIGALGECVFPAGIYIYTGSAKRNMEQRVDRHLKKEKPLRWHIDYLTTHHLVKILEVKKFTENECAVNQKTAGEILIKGFGASDCRKNCGAHLKYVRR